LPHPASEFEYLVSQQRLLADDVRDLLQLRILRLVSQADHIALRRRFPERHCHARPDLHCPRQLRRYAIIKLAIQRKIDDDFGNGLRHIVSILHVMRECQPSVWSAPRTDSPQTEFWLAYPTIKSRLPFHISVDYAILRRDGAAAESENT